MNWEAIGAIGEIIGAAAVFLTLIYLAIQVKESRRATMAQIYQDRALARGHSTKAVALNNPSHHKIMYKLESIAEREGYAKAVQELTEEERYYVSLDAQDLAIRFDNIYFQYRMGLIPDAYFDDVKEGIRIYSLLWKELKMKRGKLTSELVKLIEELDKNDGT